MMIQNIGVASLNGLASGEIQTAAARQPATDNVKTAAPVDAPGKAVEAPAAIPGREEVTQAADQINKAMQAFAQNLQFSVDEDTKMTVVKVVDTASGDVIRQIPSEEVLTIAKALDKLQGLLIRQKA